ncbi:hypothetical protein TD95_002677 [Thielaviopsis punctulata]|uniref:Uncharacterized protein n=1 Tax=Thielaviopsis punctulata TaxID=72032 RepID=A0A0F4ZHR6_9PEZI|nr:hypothetical protein TD95_002677 [Thielaviopsis punctulata]
MTKTVCVIGAGPSGLVAAKTLLHNAPKDAFSVTVFDSKPRIAGLWPTARSDFAGIVHPLMSTNISKHTQVFSDLAWHADTPQFPRAWMVGRYLLRYLETYPGAEIKLSHRVLRTAQNGTQWDVTVKSAENGEQTLTFDHLIVATGFFGTPHIPEGVPASPSVPVVHSTQYRDLNTLLGTDAPRQGKIVVVGGQLSGVETAATIALHVSSMKNLPGRTPVPVNLSVHHVVQRPTWIFPPYIPARPTPHTAAQPFVPMDIAFGNSNRRPSPLVNVQGSVSEAAAQKGAAVYQAFLGSDQGDITPALNVPEAARSDPPQLAISSYYTELVRAGQITVTQGYFTSLADSRSVQLSTGEVIDDVAAVVFATGFDPAPHISVLPPSVLDAISYKPENKTVPVALGFHGALHPDFETLGFVGFYRAPYWSVMEMQARVLAALWSPDGPSETLAAAIKADTSQENARKLQSDPRCSQFPMGDVLYINTQYATALGLTPHGPIGEALPVVDDSGKPMALTVPTRYLSPLASPEATTENHAALTQAYDDVRSALTKTKNMAGAVFRSLLGKWNLERSLVSKLPSHPSGHFSGTATFSIRAGTAHGLDKVVPDVEGGPERHWLTADNRLDFITEYVYQEIGTFTAANGFSFQASRNYIWRYDEVDDALSVWFASTSDNLQVDYLFHNVKFDPLVAADGTQKSVWTASAGHLCVEDYYKVAYEFGFKGANLEKWKIAYGVKGPNKDYRLEGHYTRVR